MFFSCHCCLLLAFVWHERISRTFNRILMREGEAPGNKNLQTIFLCDIKIKIARNRQPSAKNSSLPLLEIFLNYFFSQTRGDPTSHLFFANLRGEDCQIIRMFIYLESHKCKASCDVSFCK